MGRLFNGAHIKRSVFLGQVPIKYSEKVRHEQNICLTGNRPEGRLYGNL